MNLSLRIRTALVVALLTIGLVPLAAFAWNAYERTVAREFEDVKDRHLLLAQNLSAALSRYETDVRATIRSVAAALLESEKHVKTDHLLKTLRIQQVLIIDPGSGRLIASKKPGLPDNSSQIDAEDLRAAEMAKSGKLQFLPVQKTDEGNTIFVVGSIANKVVVARLATGYFVELGSQISFGVKGHAAIVDQAGNVLAHPLTTWIAAARNISKVSAVQRMMNGETGIEQFYSPALKGDMIAGLTTVDGPGWGVMIPQPVTELYEKAFANLKPLIVGLILSVIATLICVRMALKWLARPLENIAFHLQKQSGKGIPATIAPDHASTSISEVQRIFDSYNDLALVVQNSANELAEQSFRDTVTGIGNRRYFTNNGTAQIERRVPLGKRGVLIFVDLDGFKEINDIRGHAVGDAVLNEFASKLYPATKRFMDEEFRGIAGAHPIIGRIGGDEFAILLPIPDAVSETEEVVNLCQRLRQSLPEQVEIDGIAMSCDLSAGGAIYPDHGRTIDELTRKADVALYFAKAKGKSRFEIYSKNNALGGRSEILSGVMNAIENDELVLEYQPKFCLTKHKFTGVEALLRWIHPTHGKIPPNIFLPAIQQTHVMAKLGEWVIGRAIRDVALLEKSGHKLGVAINIGVEHFSATGFVPNLVEQCEAAEFDPGRLQIEVTENVMSASHESFNRTVKQIQKYGFTVAIDDFGKGFSNLSRLASVPVDIIKLDRSLVHGAKADERIHVIMKTAIKMAHALGSRVIVEGVETLEEVSLAENAGADALQGFYFSPALPLDNLSDWLDRANTNPQHEMVQTLERAIA